MADNKSPDDYSDLEGKAFQHGADTPRGRQEREEYRQGMRTGVGGVKTYVNSNNRYDEHR